MASKPGRGPPPPPPPVNCRIFRPSHQSHSSLQFGFLSARYSSTCRQLIAQFKTASSLLGDVVPDLEKFMKEYNLTCPAAVERIKIGVPATVEPDDYKIAKYVAEAVQVKTKKEDNLTRVAVQWSALASNGVLIRVSCVHAPLSCSFAS